MGRERGKISFLAYGLETEGSKRRDGQLELFWVVAVVADVPRQGNNELRATGLNELAHHELSGAGRGTPVHASPIIARHVLPQGVEREIRGGEVPRLAPLQIVHQTGRVAREPDRARVDEQLLGLRPGHRAPKQTQRISAHRTDRSDHDHGSA